MAGKNQKRSTNLSPKEISNQADSLTQKSLGLLVGNIFAKHGVNTQTPKLSAHDKQELLGLLKDLQASVDSLTNRNNQ